MITLLYFYFALKTKSYFESKFTKETKPFDRFLYLSSFAFLVALLPALSCFLLAYFVKYNTNDFVSFVMTIECATSFLSFLVGCFAFDSLVKYSLDFEEVE